MTYNHVAISITTTNNPPQGANQSVGLDNYYALVAIQDKVNRQRERLYALLRNYYATVVIQDEVKLIIEEEKGI